MSSLYYVMMFFLIVGANCNSNWMIFVEEGRPMMIVTEVLVLHMKINVDTAFTGHTVNITFIPNLQLMTDYCGAAKLRRLTTPHTIIQHVPYKDFTLQTINGIIRTYSNSLLAAERDENYVIFTPISLSTDPITYLVPAISNSYPSVLFGCLPFYNIDGTQYSNCRDTMMRGVIINNYIYPIFVRGHSWYYHGGPSIDTRVYMEDNNATIYARLNYKTTVVYPGNLTVITNKYLTSPFQLMSYTAKNMSSIERCEKVKMCIFRNLTNDTRIYALDPNTVTASELTIMYSPHLPYNNYQLLENATIAITDDELSDLLMVPVDSSYSIVIVILSVIMAILVFVITFLVVLVVRLIRASNERKLRRPIYQELKRTSTEV